MQRLAALVVPTILGLAAWGTSAQTSTATSTAPNPAATSTAANASGPTGTANAAEIDYFAWLSGSHRFSGAHGDSEYDIQGSRREAEVTVTGITRLAGKRVTVYINGKKVGTMPVSSRGRAEREWSTTHRQYVPLARAGSPVRVRTASGTLIVSGRYHREAD